MSTIVPGISALQSGTVTVEMIIVRVAFAGAEEIAAPASECQMVCGAPYQPFLDVVGLLAVEAAQVGIVIEY